jgi:8-amino-7-oxononanoate synthase
MSLDWLEDELNRLTAEHLLRRPAIRGGPQGVRIVVSGQELINFGSNDYLGLAADPRVTDSVTRALRTMGWGSGASPLITGRSSSQAELERHLATFEHTEAAIVFPSGFAANAGTLACLADRGDVIFSDAKNHASLIDGCRLSRAEVQVYPHADMAALKQRLRDSRTARRRLIVTDSLFSMDGDLAPLTDLVELAAEYRALLVVDEAHATGVWGASGRGVCELAGVESLVPVRIGTLSKALGSIGGFVAGSRQLIDWLFNCARPFVFSTALPAVCHVASLAALKIVRDEPQRRAGLLAHARELRQQLRQQGWNVGAGESQIIPLRVGDAARTMELAGRLRDRGVLVPGIRPPTVPPGESLLRISLTSGHQSRHIEQLIGALAELRA